MKVCHITSVHIYNDTRVFVKECQSLSKQYEVHLIAPNAPSEKIDGIYVHGVHGTDERLKRITSTVRKVYRKALNVNADVYHFHDPELIYVGLLLKKKGKKVVYDVHEDVPKQVLSKDWIPPLFKRPIGWFIKRIESYASKRFDGIITATPEISDRFQTYSSNTVTVQNFPLLKEWEGEQVSPASVKENKAVYVGFISKPRGILEMVEAIGEVNKSKAMDAGLLLGGKFTSSDLEATARNSDGWQYVDFMGWLNREQVRDAMQRARVGLVLIHPEPRYKVSYPVKLFEYMSSGIPVIASDFPLWRSIVEKSDCGLCVDPLNPIEIAEALDWFFKNPEEARRMGENGRKAVEHIYNWDPEAQKLIQLYHTLETGKVKSH